MSFPNRSILYDPTTLQGLDKEMLGDKIQIALRMTVIAKMRKREREKERERSEISTGEYMGRKYQIRKTRKKDIDIQDKLLNIARRGYCVTNVNAYKFYINANQ